MAITICTQCIHFLNLEPTGPRAEVWYNHICRASPLPRIIDPYDGQEKSYRINDLGQQHFSDKEFDYCQEINKGDCPKFEAKEQEPTIH